MKYFRKPDTTGIEVTRIASGHSVPDGVQVREIEGIGFEVYNKLHDSWIKLGKDGLVRIDKAPDDVYPIDREYLDESFVAAKEAR